METNLLRSGVWDPCGMAKPDAAPFTARTLLGMEPERATGRLSITDMAVLAAVITHLDPEGNCCPTSLYELSMAVFGGRGGEELRLTFASLERLVQLTLSLPGYDAVEDRVVGSLTGGSMVNLVQAIYVEHRRLSIVSRRELGALKNTHNVKVVLAEWLTRQVRAGNTTWLDLQLLRALGPGLAGRLWAFLEGERLNPDQDGLRAGHVGLGPPALTTLGLAGYARESDARKKLRKAAARIVATDPAWVSIDVIRRAGWQLVFRRRPSGKEIAQRRRVAAANGDWSKTERRRVRALARQSLQDAELRRYGQVPLFTG